MKHKIIRPLLALLFACVASGAMAQSNFIKGTIDIEYKSKQTPNTKGVKDVYTININVCNSTVYHGTITDQPQIIEGLFSKEVTQPRQLDYDIACDVVNPKNVAETKNVGRLYGKVPINPSGVYMYSDSSLVIDVLPIGNAGGFTSKFRGSAKGKPMNRPQNWLDTLQAQTVNITRSVNGKVSTVQLKKYDKMEFNQCVLAAGPVAIYQQVTVNGEMLYDYDKNCWFLNNITMQYAESNLVRSDRVTGTMRWIESPQRKQNGEGEYQFDVRVNEPPVDPAKVFTTSDADESAFFTTDTAIPAIVGTMKYKDALNSSGETMSSKVTLNLTGNNITKLQTMALTKMIIFASVVPMNSD